MNIVSSQVSQIPGTISDRWNKERRFNACWELIKELQPSKRIPIDVVPLERAQEAFERLANRDIRCIQFSYDQNCDISGKRGNLKDVWAEETTNTEDENHNP